jgi:hypothetical protein
MEQSIGIPLAMRTVIFAASAAFSGQVTPADQAGPAVSRSTSSPQPLFWPNAPLVRGSDLSEQARTNAVKALEALAEDRQIVLSNDAQTFFGGANRDILVAAGNERAHQLTIRGVARDLAYALDHALPPQTQRMATAIVELTAVILAAALEDRRFRPIAEACLGDVEERIKLVRQLDAGLRRAVGQARTRALLEAITELPEALVLTTGGLACSFAADDLLLEELLPRELREQRDAAQEAKSALDRRLGLELRRQVGRLVSAATVEVARSTLADAGSALEAAREAIKIAEAAGQTTFAIPMVDATGVVAALEAYERLLQGACESLIKPPEASTDGGGGRDVAEGGDVEDAGFSLLAA